METSDLDIESTHISHAARFKRGFTYLRFRQPVLEKEFRDTFLEYSLKRGRLAGIVAFGLVLVVAGINHLFGRSETRFPLDILSLVIVAPAVLVGVAAMCLDATRRWYTTIASVGVMIAGVVITCMCHIAALAGDSFYMVGQELVMVYAFLFLGLLFNSAVAIAFVLVGVHLASGLILGLPTESLLYMTAMLVATAVISLDSMYKLEHAMRDSFLETNRLHEAADRDGMTNLYNRRMFDDYVGRLWRQSHREGKNLEVIFVDIDYFKSYNDLYGHQAGDECLKKVARAIGNCAKRPFDFCARYGGEEFVLILYGPPEDYGRSVPEQILRDVMALGIPHEGSDASDVVTVSIGVALDVPRSKRSLTGAIQVADEALYEAKNQGRNCVVFKTTEDDVTETGNFRNAFWESTG